MAQLVVVKHRGVHEQRRREVDPAEQPARVGQREIADRRAPGHVALGHDVARVDHAVGIQEVLHTAHETLLRLQRLELRAHRHVGGGEQLAGPAVLEHRVGAERARRERDRHRRRRQREARRRGERSHLRPVQRPRPVGVLKELRRVEVLAALDDGTERDPVGVVCHLDIGGEVAIHAIRERLPRQRVGIELPARHEVGERRHAGVLADGLLVGAVERVVVPRRQVVVLEAALEMAVERVQQLVVGLAAQRPRRLLLVVVAGTREVHVVVRGPVVAAIANELAGRVVEPEFELREQEPGMPARLDREHVKRQHQHGNVPQVEHHRLRHQLVLEVDLHPA